MTDQILRENYRALASPNAKTGQSKDRQLKTIVPTGPKNSAILDQLETTLFTPTFSNNTAFSFNRNYSNTPSPANNVQSRSRTPGKQRDEENFDEIAAMKEGCFNAVCAGNSINDEMDDLTKQFERECGFNSATDFTDTNALADEFAAKDCNQSFSQQDIDQTNVDSDEENSDEEENEEESAAVEACVAELSPTSSSGVEQSVLSNPRFHDDAVSMVVPLPDEAQDDFDELFEDGIDEDDDSPVTASEYSKLLSLYSRDIAAGKLWTKSNAFKGRLARKTDYEKKMAQPFYVCLELLVSEYYLVCEMKQFKATWINGLKSIQSASNLNAKDITQLYPRAFESLLTLHDKILNEFLRFAMNVEPLFQHFQLCVEDNIEFAKYPERINKEELIKQFDQSTAEFVTVNLCNIVSNFISELKLYGEYNAEYSSCIAKYEHLKQSNNRFVLNLKPISSLDRDRNIQHYISQPYQRPSRYELLVKQIRQNNSDAWQGLLDRNCTELVENTIAAINKLNKHINNYGHIRDLSNRLRDLTIDLFDENRVLLREDKIVQLKPKQKRLTLALFNDMLLLYCNEDYKYKWISLHHVENMQNFFQTLNENSDSEDEEGGSNNNNSCLSFRVRNTNVCKAASFRKTLKKRISINFSSQSASVEKFILQFNTEDNRDSWMNLFHETQANHVKSNTYQTELTKIYNTSTNNSTSSSNSSPLITTTRSNSITTTMRSPSTTPSTPKLSCTPASKSAPASVHSSRRNSTADHCLSGITKLDFSNLITDNDAGLEVSTNLNSRSQANSNHRTPAKSSLISSAALISSLTNRNSSAANTTPAGKKSNSGSAATKELGSVTPRLLSSLNTARSAVKPANSLAHRTPARSTTAANQETPRLLSSIKPLSIHPGASVHNSSAILNASRRKSGNKRRSGGVENGVEFVPLTVEGPSIADFFNHARRMSESNRRLSLSLSRHSLTGGLSVGAVLPQGQSGEAVAAESEFEQFKDDLQQMAQFELEAQGMLNFD
jgi:hypothetical protein